MKHIPNLLSIFRILLIPVILRVYLAAGKPGDYFLAGLLLAVSGITDMADGYIARKWNFITNVGKVLDPIADKLTQISMAVAIWLRHEGLWPLPVFLFIKEAATAICGLWIYRKEGVVSSARWYGKMATTIYYLVMFGLMAFPWMLEENTVWFPIAMIGLAMVFAGIRYAVEFRRDLQAIKSKKSTEQPGAVGEQGKKQEPYPATRQDIP